MRTRITIEHQDFCWVNIMEVNHSYVKANQRLSPHHQEWPHESGVYDVHHRISIQYI